jgi:hypothetical protein
MYIHVCACREPKQLQAVTFLLVDDLLQGQEEGYRMIDHSLPLGSPDRVFYMRCVLLFMVGDYPGQGKLANMLHSGKQGCHWCMQRFEHHCPGHNVALGNRRHLPAHNSLRDDPRFGAPCRPDEHPTPPLRAHAQTLATGKEIESTTGTERSRKEKSTGIYGFCFFAFLFLFDVVWDFMPDMMHIIKDLWQGYFIPYFKGDVEPATPKAPSRTYKRGRQVRHYTLEEMENRTQKHQLAVDRHEKIMRVRNYNAHLVHYRPMCQLMLHYLRTIVALFMQMSISTHVFYVGTVGLAFDEGSD